MQTIYELRNSYWTGNVRTIEDDEPCPINWIRSNIPPPNTTKENEFLFWSGDWSLVILPKNENNILFNSTDDCIKYVEQLMDFKAKEYGYDNILSACSYKDTSNEKFAKEGKAFSLWRDAIWSKTFELIDEIKNGTKKFEDFISNLPKLEIT